MAYRGLGQTDTPDDTVEGNDTETMEEKSAEEDKKAGWIILALLAGGAYFLLKK